MARTPVLPDATLVSALSAQLRRTDIDPQCPLYVDTGRPGRKQALLVQMIVREKL